MNKQKIKQLDLYLAQHKGLLSDAEEERYIDLVVEGYSAPEPEDGEEETPVPLELLRLNKKLQLLVRDSSPEVNSFVIAGRSMWFTPDLRANLRNAIDALEETQEESVSFKGITLPINMAKAALSAIERYAAKCSEKTDAHAAAIMALQSAEDIERYDITVGYPEMPNFNQEA